MVTTRRERKKERTRTDLIECAVALFREKGFTETSIDEITEKADVSKGTLYNHFQDKESILVGYFQNKIATSSNEFRAKLLAHKNIEVRLNALLDFVFQILIDDLDLASIYFRYRLNDLSALSDARQRSGIETLVVEIIEEAQKNGELRSDLPSVIIARSFQFVFMSFLLFNTQGKKPADLNPYKAQILELFLHGAKHHDF